MNSEKEIRQLHLQLAEKRGFDKTYCPSEVAKQFAPLDWRSKMDVVRKIADELVSSGQLIVLQNEQIIKVNPSEAKGPIRLRRS